MKRIMKRDNKSEEDANKRLDMQSPATEQLKSAHVALSTLFEPEEARKQVAKAVELLRKRI